MWLLSQSIDRPFINTRTSLWVYLLVLSLSRSYLWLLTVAVNDYLMRYSPYTLRLMVYVTESLSYMLSISFQKLGSPPFLFFLLSLIVGSSSTSSSNTYSFSTSISKSNDASVGKDASYYPLCFSRENIKEAIVLDTVADLIPVNLICNHEVKATKLCHTCRISIFFILQVDFYYKSLFHYFDTEKRVSLVALMQ